MKLIKIPSEVKENKVGIPIIDDSSKKEVTHLDPSLRSLKITYYSKLSDNIIQRILHSCPNITSLDFEQKIAWTYPNLESLDIKGNQSITGYSIYKIAQSCKNILHLDISFCGGVTDDFVYKIVGACHKLELLCIEDISVNKMLKQIHNLEYLELDQCRYITDLSIPIDEIATHCSNLKFLAVQCTNVSQRQEYPGNSTSPNRI
ncbi:hypothetical protein Glove_48g36 [Diversispora epigaea]|uniref:F-box domain-containing protein n=1 Tax=Diversispora epigaea TaxID=1348612 RepID=A0A397JF50_9GLOM|nr:hypothetical protein Glove_48g36 [Diversispora epigaea]